MFKVSVFSLFMYLINKYTKRLLYHTGWYFCRLEWTKIVIRGNESIVLLLTRYFMYWTHDSATNKHRSLISPLSLTTVFCDLTLWRHHSWSCDVTHCDVIFVDCSCTRKFAQRRHSLVNNNREYRFRTTKYSRLKVQENMILHISLQWQINQSWNTQYTPIAMRCILWDFLRKSIALWRYRTVYKQERVSDYTSLVHSARCEKYSYPTQLLPQFPQIYRQYIISDSYSRAQRSRYPFCSNMSMMHR